MPAIKSNHVSVCICTYKRPELLGQLLEKLESQVTEGLFNYSAVVADNDRARSAEQVAARFNSARLQVTYCVEERQNIALARNKAIENAEGDYIAFIDDDEFPIDDWLYNLFTALQGHDVDGVLGPVKPYFNSEPPSWVKDGKFFDRPAYATGYKLKWNETRTGNVLFSRKILDGVELPFDPQFNSAGEDLDFFRRMMQQGHEFKWCEEGFVYEVVPAERCTRKYLLRRALLRGTAFSKHPADRLTNASKSLIAVPCYTVALPVLALFGQHVFIKYLIKLFDHASRLLAYVGLPVVTERDS
jgi:succinoglycan biosynthesis protein ExoM